MSHQYRESRIAYAGTTRRIALDPLEFRGQRVTALGPGDSVTYTVYNADRSLLVPQTNASYAEIALDKRGVPVIAWTGVIPVGLLAQQIQVLWEITIGGSSEVFFDTIEVLASPLMDRIATLAATACVN